MIHILKSFILHFYVQYNCTIYTNLTASKKKKQIIASAAKKVRKLRSLHCALAEVKWNKLPPNLPLLRQNHKNE